MSVQIQNNRFIVRDLNVFCIIMLKRNFIDCFRVRLIDLRLESTCSPHTHASATDIIAADVIAADVRCLCFGFRFCFCLRWSFRFCFGFAFCFGFRFLLSFAFWYSSRFLLGFAF